MDDKKTTHPPQVPDFKDEEMKMPKEKFGAGAVFEPNPEPKTRSLGPFILILTIILLLVLAGLYMWSQTFLENTPITPTENSVVRPTAEENNKPESTSAEAQATSLDIVSTSNELDSIEADLESTDLNNLDAELQAIEIELENQE